MLSRCPYPDCSKDTEVEEHVRSWLCPYCRRPFSPRPLEVLGIIDRQWQRYQQRLESENGSLNANAPGNIVAVLEDIRSLWNVGSIFRTADGAGISHLYLCGITGIPPRKEIAKTSLGAEDTVPWTYRPHAISVIEKMRAGGFQILGLECTADSLPLSEAAGKPDGRPVCLIVGNEVTGISAETLSLCDVVCDLPMRGVKESLNVAVAFGIAAYALTG